MFVYKHQGYKYRRCVSAGGRCIVAGDEREYINLKERSCLMMFKKGL